MYKPPIKGRGKKIQPMQSQSPSAMPDGVSGLVGLVSEINDIKSGLSDKISEVVSIANEASEAVNEKLASVDAKMEEIEQATVEVLEHLRDTSIKGEDADEDSIVEKLKVHIPAPVDLAKLQSDILSKVPVLDTDKLTRTILSKIPENRASLKVIQEKIETDPMSVIDRILANPEALLKIKSVHTEGLDQTISAFRNQTARGYLHGGGLSTVSHDATLTGLGTPASPLSAVGGGGGTPGGLNTQLQYNNAGAFGGITGAVTDGTSVSLTGAHLLNPTINGAGVGLATLTYPNTPTSVSIAFPSTSGTVALTSQLTSGTVTSVATNATLTGGPITSSGTLGLNLGNANSWTATQNFPNIGINKSAFTTIGVDVYVDNSNLSQGIRIEGSVGTLQSFSTFVSGDLNSRFAFRADGRFLWGNGTLGTDTNLYRTGIGVLNTDNAFVVGTNLTTTDGTATFNNSASVGNVANFLTPNAGYVGFTNGRIYSASGQFQIYANGGSPFALGINGTTALTVDTTQRIGIGASISSPSALLHIAAGTSSASTAPLKFTAGTNLATAEAGAQEFDGKVFTVTAAPSSRQVIPATQFITLTSAFTTAGGTTSLQKLFNAPSGGTLTAAANTAYYFECYFTLNSMSSTSGTLSFGLGGTATYTRVKYFSTAAKAALSGSTPTFTNANTAAATVISGSTNVTTTGWAMVTGKIVVGTGGTIVPSFATSVAAATVVEVDSYFRIWAAGSDTVQSVGNWS